MQTSKQMGVNRSYDPSLSQKGIFASLHLLIVFSCVWLVYFNGLTNIGHLLGKSWQFADASRAGILIFCAVLYWFRHLVTLFYLLYRKVGWSEVFGLLFFFALFEIGFVLIGGGVFRDHSIALGWLDVLAFALLLFGSYLNSYSEMQRKWWKADPANKGHCYTKNLFSYSMHINFFGDVLMFTGWALFTHSLWSLSIPLLMAFSFVFFHIPTLDRYLAHRYGDEFKHYAKKTKVFIPFIY